MPANAHLGKVHLIH
jgi:hypothetical protein